VTRLATGNGADVRVEVEQARRLWFDDGAPVRAASAVVPYGDGRLVVQDDATHAAWVRSGSITPVRVFPPVEGLDVFDAVAGTKHLKPDLEAACPLGPDRVLVLGSGSTPARCRLAVVTPDGVQVRDVPDLYAAVGALLETPPGALNLEGACLVEGRLRWFRRGAADLPSASVDLDLDALLAVVAGTGSEADVPLSNARRYELGGVDGVALGITDAIALPDGRVLASAAAEDTPNPVDDGPVVGAVLLVLDDDRLVATGPVPVVDGAVPKVEGLALLEQTGNTMRVVAVVDDDDPQAASAELVLRLTF
jgi:hypothetical protein